DVTTYTDASAKAMTEYYYRVVALNAKAQSMLPTAIFTATPATTPLRSPWLSKDIGGVKGTGASSYANNVFTLIGNGGDIWDRSDAFRYTYQPLTGDGQIIARISAIEDTDGWAKVGLMIRESLTANARNAFVALTPDNGITMQYRVATGGTSNNITGAKVSAPYYLKLVRKGNTFTGYASSNGSTWTTVGTINISMTTSVYIGLAVTSHTDTELNTCTIDKVTVANREPTIATPAASSADPVTSTSALLSILGADDHGETNLIYSWETTALPAGALTPTFSDNDTNDAKNVTVNFSQAGTYTFLGTIIDSSGISVSSSVTVTVAQTPTAAAITPSSPATLQPGQNQQFSLVLRDQFNQPITTSPLPQWQVTSGGGSIDSTGLFTAPQTPQDSTITATAGALSASIIVTTIAPPLVEPTNLTPHLQPGGAVELSWQDNSNGETGFQIERSIDGAAFLSIGTVLPDQTTFTDAVPSAGIILYRVAAMGPDTLAYATDSALALIGNDSDDLFSIASNQSATAILLQRNTAPVVSVPPAALNKMVLTGHAGADILQVSDCSLTFNTDLGAATPALTVQATSASLTFAASQHLANLALGDFSSAAFAGSSASLLSTRAISIANTATLDLTNNSLIVSATPETKQAMLAAISNVIMSARGVDSTWTGTGLTSSTAQANKLTGLAILLNDADSKPVLTSFAGQSVTENDILVKYTWNGDVDLNGIVDGDDYFLVDSGFITQASSYQNGDLNLDGVIDGDDYFLIDSAFIAQTGILTTAKEISPLQQLFSTEPLLG
ncbi:MAG: hypothetical protein ACM359_21515, partial [Bacillota bacterium]